MGASPQSNQVNALLFDADDNLWLATDDGLYRASAVSSSDLQFELVVPHPPTAKGMAAFADSRGRLWFGMENELIQVVRDRIIKYGRDDEVGRHEIKSIVEDRQGRLLVANQRAVFEFVAPPNGNVDGKGRGRWQRLPLVFKPDQEIAAMFSDSAGALWVGAFNGLLKYQDGKQILYLCEHFWRRFRGDRRGESRARSRVTSAAVCQLVVLPGQPRRLVDRQQ